MKQIKITKDSFLTDEEILLITSIDSRPVKTFVAQAKDKGMYISLSGNKTSRTAIITKTGFVIVSDASVETIVKRREEVNKLE